jgi:hypothetical protein
MIECLLPTPGCLDEHAHLLADSRLSMVVGKLLWPNRTVEGLVIRNGLGRGQSIMFNARHLECRLFQRLANDLFG